MKLVFALCIVFMFACAQTPWRITSQSTTKNGGKGSFDVCELLVTPKPSNERCSIKVTTPWGYKNLNMDCNSFKGRRVMPLIDELMLRECGGVRLPKRASK